MFIIICTISGSIPAGYGAEGTRLTYVTINLFYGDNVIR